MDSPIFEDIADAIGNHLRDGGFGNKIEAAFDDWMRSEVLNAFFYLFVKDGRLMFKMYSENDANVVLPFEQLLEPLLDDCRDGGVPRDLVSGLLRAAADKFDSA